MTGTVLKTFDHNNRFYSAWYSSSRHIYCGTGCLSGASAKQAVTRDHGIQPKSGILELVCRLRSLGAAAAGRAWVPSRILKHVPRTSLDAPHDATIPPLGFTLHSYSTLGYRIDILVFSVPQVIDPIVAL